MHEFFFFALLTLGVLLVALPWLIAHYLTKWKTAATLTNADEQLLDELYDMARRLDERLCTIERIIAADIPDWRQQCLPGAHPLDPDVRRRPSPIKDRP